MNNISSSQSIISNNPEPYETLWILPIELEPVDTTSLINHKNVEFKKTLDDLLSLGQCQISNELDQSQVEDRSSDLDSETIVQEINDVEEIKGSFGSEAHD